MKLVIFGLTISSSWGNGHATLWRGLCNALTAAGHTISFFEQNLPYYEATRDFFDLPNGSLIFYEDWKDISSRARRELSDADVAIVTSYCPDAIDASTLVLGSSVSVRCFYDLDTPVTLSELEQGRSVRYIGPRGFRDFDLVLSYSGGPSLEKLEKLLGARAVAPLYGSVDPALHFPVKLEERYRSDLSYLGTFATDRQERLERLFVEPSRRLPESRFFLGGSKYEEGFPWQKNIYRLEHIPAAHHPAFYCSARLNLNVTRQAMFDNGYCPSGRLFEAAACGAPIISDNWPGISDFFEPGDEILVASEPADVVEALDRSPEDLSRIAWNARARTMEHHTASARAQELETIMNQFRRTSSSEVY